MRRLVFRRRIGGLLAGVVTMALYPSLVMAAVAPGQPGDFGFGAMLGAPTGLSLKYWLNETAAIDGALAWHFGDNSQFQIHTDYLWHLPISGVTVPNGKLPFYVGAGLRVIAGDHSNAGIRIPLGLSYLVERAPVEVFAEVVPVVKFAPDTEGDIDGAIGVRYYFKTR